MMHLKIKDQLLYYKVKEKVELISDEYMQHISSNPYNHAISNEKINELLNNLCCEDAMHYFTNIKYSHVDSDVYEWLYENMNTVTTNTVIQDWIKFTLTFFATAVDINCNNDEDTRHIINTLNDAIWYDVQIPYNMSVSYWGIINKAVYEVFNQHKEAYKEEFPESLYNLFVFFLDPQSSRNASNLYYEFLFNMNDYGDHDRLTVSKQWCV